MRWWQRIKGTEQSRLDAIRALMFQHAMERLNRIWPK